MASAPEASAAHVPAHNWGWFLLRGILALLLGLAAIAFPLSALFAFTLLFAAYAFADGLASLVSGIPGTKEHKGWGALIFRGVTGILVGLLFLVLPAVATISYAYVTLAMLAVWSIIAGTFEIAAAIRLRRAIEGELMLGLSGLISLLLGIAIIVFVMPVPAATMLSAAWLIAIFAFVSGILLVMQALRLRKTGITLQPPRQ
ncbi:MAG: DUF308 domain-containing protein [Sphingomonas sp.]|uniref:HdeD family acid-resistance protein n=1 Tax=Sphingomonas sp. TaxID=28214 RepID=UPI00227270F9|nr:DUF308 domain-containing protein [Sphingomonas sp.]MCX8474884.1 DUF308 domain-containing protein [Sphingomonas sp.]